MSSTPLTDHEIEQWRTECHNDPSLHEYKHILLRAFATIQSMKARPITTDPRLDTRELCPICDQPIANKADYEPTPEHPAGCECDECMSLCWGDPQCDSNAVDWRAECLAARAKAAELRHALQRALTLNTRTGPLVFDNFRTNVRDLLAKT